MSNIIMEMDWIFYSRHLKLKVDLYFYKMKELKNFQSIEFINRRRKLS